MVRGDNFFTGVILLWVPFLDKKNHSFLYSGRNGWTKKESKIDLAVTN